MKRHASPYYPSNGALKKTREREWRKRKARTVKGKVMRKTVLGIMGVVLCLSAIIGVMAVVSADGGEPTKAGYADGCEYWLAGYACEGTPGVGSPVPVVTPTATLAPVETVVVVAEPTTVIDTIIQLPATGAGTTAHSETIERAHTGNHWYRYCANGILWEYRVYAAWVWSDYHGNFGHHHNQFVGQPYAVNVCY